MIDTEPRVIKITNEDYFFMIDNQIRTAMMKAETEKCLPAAKTVLEKSGVAIAELKAYPIEGYYYETPELKLYMTILRNLQHNEDVYKRVVKCEELTFLQNWCNNDLFGVEDPHKRNQDSPLKRRYDILTLTMEDESSFNPKHNHPWSISSIMESLNKQYAGRTNLVELAYLTGNPKCLCCGAETNSAYRMIACISGSYSLNASFNPVVYVWDVSPQVELLGMKIVAAYNELFGGLFNSIVFPSLKNHHNLNKLAKVPRVAILGYISATKEYYHWILDEYRLLTDVYSKEIITTETFTNKTQSGFTGNIFNAKAAV
jgi:hypothetical protein